MTTALELIQGESSTVAQVITKSDVAIVYSNKPNIIKAGSMADLFEAIANPVITPSAKQERVITVVERKVIRPNIVVTQMQGPPGVRGLKGDPGPRGEKGERGDVGPAAPTATFKRYAFAPALTWRVTHNMGTTMFQETLTDANGRRFHASLRVLNPNEFEIGLTEAMGGTVDVLFAPSA